MNDGVDYEKRATYLFIALLFTIFVIIILTVGLVDAKKKLNDPASSQDQSHTEQEYTAAVDCFKYADSQLVDVNDAVLLVGSSGETSFSELSDAVSKVKDLADGGNIVSLADGTKCP